MFKYHTFTLISLQEWTMGDVNWLKQVKGKVLLFEQQESKYQWSKNNIFTLAWFQGLKYRHVDSCNQTKGKVVLSEIWPQKEKRVKRNDDEGRYVCEMYMKCIWFYMLFSTLQRGSLEYKLWGQPYWKV